MLRNVYTVKLWSGPWDYLSQKHFQISYSKKLYESKGLATLMECNGLKSVCLPAPSVGGPGPSSRSGECQLPASWRQPLQWRRGSQCAFLGFFFFRVLNSYDFCFFARISYLFSILNFSPVGSSTSGAVLFYHVFLFPFQTASVHLHFEPLKYLFSLPFNLCPSYALGCSLICANLESRELPSFPALLLTGYIVEGQSLYISARFSRLWKEGVGPDALKPFLTGTFCEPVIPPGAREDSATLTKSCFHDMFVRVEPEWCCLPRLEPDYFLCSGRCRKYSWEEILCCKRSQWTRTRGASDQRLLPPGRQVSRQRSRAAEPTRGRATAHRPPVSKVIGVTVLPCPRFSEWR